MALRNQRIKSTRHGTYRLNLPEEERQLMAHLLAQVKELVTAPAEETDDRVKRLFPVAYANDAAQDAEYQHYMRDELVASRVAAIETVLETLQAKDITESQLMAWMRSVNAVRLVLGTMLDIHEDDAGLELTATDPHFGEHALYDYLSYLLEQIIEAIGDPSD